MQGNVPMYTPRGPTGFGRDIIFGSMSRTTEPMRSNINIDDNRRNRSMGNGVRHNTFKRAIHTEGKGFFDALLNIGKKLLPSIGKIVTAGPFGEVIKSLIPQIPEILDKASGREDLDPMIQQLLEITKDPEIRRLIAELTGKTTTTSYSY